MNRQPTKKPSMPVPKPVKGDGTPVDQTVDQVESTQGDDLAEDMAADLADIDPEAAALIGEPEESEESEDDLMMDRITERKNIPKKPEVKYQLKKINVVATQDGVYGGERKVDGDKFTIKSEQEFSKVWMKKI